MVVIIEIERCMFHGMKWIFVSIWYLFGIVIECFLLLYHFEFYLCYIWILGVIAGYPILYCFSKLGDLINRDFTSEEQKMYYRVSSIWIGIIGICILLFVLFGKFSGIDCKNLDSKTIFFSKFLISVARIIVCVKQCFIEKD